MTFAPKRTSGTAMRKMAQPVELPAVDSMENRYDAMLLGFYDYVTGRQENPFSYDHEYAVQKVLWDAVGGVEMLGALEHASEVQGMLGKLMMDAMEAYIAENSQSDDIGKQVAEKVNKVADAAKELSDALLRKVTAQELAAETEIPLEEIQEAMRLAASKIDEIEETDGK